jgi:hypothetical protein
LSYGEPDAISNAVEYPMFFGRSHHGVIRVDDEADNVIETHEHAGDFEEARSSLPIATYPPFGSLCYAIPAFNRSIMPLESFLPVS